MIKQVFLIKRKNEMSHEEFKKYYLGHHVPLIKEAFPELIKYVINFVHQGKRETEYDCITELYWPSFETLKKLGDADVYQKKVIPDELVFINTETRKVFLTEEFVAKNTL
jgi:hypothetical protein